MRADDRADFASFVGGSAHRLLAAATELTGDRAAAEEALLRGLERAYRSWGRVRRAAAPEDEVHRFVVAAASSLRRGPAPAATAAGAPTPTAAGPAPVPPGGLVDQVVARAHRRARTRAAAVAVLAAAAAAAAGVTLAGGHPARTSQPLPGPSAQAVVVGTGAVTAVAVAGDLLYVATAGDAHPRLTGYDRRSRRPVASVALPGPARRVVAGHGTVWVSFDPEVADLRSLLWHLSGNLGAYDGHYVRRVTDDAEPAEILAVGPDRALLATDLGLVRVTLPPPGRRGDGTLRWLAAPPALRAGVVWVGAAGPALWAQVGPPAGRRLVRLEADLGTAPGDRVAAVLPASAGRPRVWGDARAVWVGGGAGQQLLCVGAGGTGALGRVRLANPGRPADVAVSADTVYAATRDGVESHPVPPACAG